MERQGNEFEGTPSDRSEDYSVKIKRAVQREQIEFSPPSRFLQRREQSQHRGLNPAAPVFRPASRQPSIVAHEAVAVPRRENKRAQTIFHKGTILKPFHASQRSRSSDKLPEVLGQVRTMSMTQQGSRQVQTAIENAGVKELESIINELSDHLHELMTHPYANYMCSTLFRCISAEQRLSLVTQLSPHLHWIATDKCGTHCLQTLVDLASLPAEERVYIQLLEHDLYNLAINEQATHIAQKIISNLSKESRSHVIDLVLQKFHILAWDKYGLCVVKKCIQVVDSEQKLQLLQMLSRNLLELVQSPYGNYAVQYAIQEWGTEFALPLLNLILDRVAQLSIQKFASNVIERALEFSPSPLRKRYIDEICKEESVRKMLRSKFAMFVVKKAIEVGTLQERHQIITTFEAYIQSVIDKKLKLQWEQLLEAY